VIGKTFFTECLAHTWDTFISGLRPSVIFRMDAAATPRSLRSVGRKESSTLQLRYNM